MAEEGESESVFNNFSSLSKDILRQCINKWELIEKTYRDQMLKNPEIASKLESFLRVLSYFLPGRFGTSEALAELVYSASQLLTLMHDGVFRQGKGISICNSVKDGGKLVVLLTIVEYLEVFIELGAEKILGEAGKWLIVLIIQIFKAALRFLLLYYYKSGIQCSPLITPFDRSELAKDDTGPGNAEGSKENEVKVLFRGARTRRNVRTLTAVPEDSFRTWKLPRVPKTEQSTSKEQPEVTTELTSKQIVGESLYISRPLIHITSMFLFGQRSWKPWLLSCSADITSLALLGDPSDLNTVERAEVSRRSVLLLFYLLRSPFYDVYSKAKIIVLLKYLSESIPGFSMFLDPLLEYLPTWQRIYFYNWSS